MAAGDSERAHLGRAGIEALHEATQHHLEAMRSYCRCMMRSWLNLLSG